MKSQNFETIEKYYKNVSDCKIKMSHLQFYMLIIERVGKFLSLDTFLFFSISLCELKI